MHPNRPRITPESRRVRRVDEFVDNRPFPRPMLPRPKPTMSFEALLAGAGGILSKFSFRGSRKTIPGQHVKSFAFDLCLVASGIR